MLDVHFAVGLAGDDRSGSALDKPGAQGVAVITLVGDQIAGWRYGIDRLDSDLGIVRAARRQQEDVRAALLVADGMEVVLCTPRGPVLRPPLVMPIP